jgi:hypothetical protein
MKEMEEFFFKKKKNINDSWLRSSKSWTFNKNIFRKKSLDGYFMLVKHVFDKRFLTVIGLQTL